MLARNVGGLARQKEVDESEQVQLVVRCYVTNWKNSLVGPQAGSMGRRELLASAAVSPGIWSRSWGFGSG